MSRQLSVGTIHAGIYCGERALAVRHWYTHYGFFRRVENGFSLGPVLFWRGSS